MAKTQKKPPTGSSVARNSQDAPPQDSQADGYCSAEWLCSKTGLTDRRHRQIAAAGYFPSPIRGRYQTGLTLLGMIRYLSEQNRKKDDHLRQEQEQLTRAKRQLAEEELAALRGRYVERDLIGPALRNLSLHQRAVLQRKLEQELAPNLVGLTTVEILSRIKPMVDELCAIFREGTKQWLDSPPAELPVKKVSEIQK